MIKLGLICSSGGHLMQLHLLQPFWGKYDRFWVSEDKTDVNSLLDGERVYYGRFPTTRNVLNLFRNTLLALKLLIKEKPDLIISNGAGIAVPFFYVAKIFGIKTIYIEVYDRIDSATLTGKLVSPIADSFIVQWESQQSIYKKATLLGRIL